MNSAMFLIVSVASGAFFEVHTIPLEPAPSRNMPASVTTFFANADSDGVADLNILQGNKLTVLSSAAEIREALLPQGVSAFDIADIDGDGKYEVVAVQGKSILRVSLALEGDTPDARVLFQADSLYANAPGGGTPTVLLSSANRAGKPGIALPTPEGIEWHAIDGTVFDTVPYESSASWMDVAAATAATPAKSLQLNFLLSRMVALQKNEADELRDHSAPHSSGYGSRLRQATSEKPEDRPWFLVHRTKDKSTRAYCAVEESLMTVVSMCDVAVDAEGLPAGPITPGPARRYPGAMVTKLNQAPPDFNGDGYADMLLWNAPRPGISVDALLRVVVGRNWPITLTTHLYSPDKGRFEPAPATELTYRIPVSWFLTGLVPLRHYVMADFNGDKKTDLGMCTEENEYSIWLYSDGFAAMPDEKHKFSENITGVELTGDCAGNGKTSIVLRSDHYVYVLYAK